MESSGYAFRDRDHEEQRLRSQAELFDPLTERAFRAAGLSTGMRVLDIGSGAGDVAMLAARLVGSGGKCSALNAIQPPSEPANERARDAALGNVRFVQGDGQTLDGVTGPFDAVVGRLVLMYLPDLAAAVARATTLLASGGIVCFQEGDMAYEWAQPMTELWTMPRAWFLETLSRARIALRMALELPATFLAAGLPSPEVCLECAVSARDPHPVWG